MKCTKSILVSIAFMMKVMTTETIINFAVLTNMLFSNRIDFRTYKGVSIESDHYLIGAKTKSQNVKKTKGI